MWTPEACALQLCLFRRRAPPTPAHAASRGSEGLLSLPFGQGSLLLPHSPDPLETPRPRRGCPLGKLPWPPCAWPGSPPTPALFRFVSRCGVQGSIAPVTPVPSDSSFPATGRSSQTERGVGHTLRQRREKWKAAGTRRLTPSGHESTESHGHQEPRRSCLRPWEQAGRDNVDREGPCQRSPTWTPTEHGCPQDLPTKTPRLGDG